MNPVPAIIPATAPRAVTQVVNTPSTSAGKKLAAASPKANATTAAT